MKRISVIVPTCHRPEMLARCLEKLSVATEIIVTDDSRDTVTRELVGKTFPHARWTRGPQRGPAANRNHGARVATGDWLAFVDDDCEPDAHWLGAIAKTMNDADVIEGKTICPNKRDTPFEEHVENLRGGVLWSCNFAIRRTAFEHLGGFDEDFLEPGGEDMEFAWRVKHAGYRVVFEPEALVVHPARRLAWPNFWRRTTWQLRWGVLYRIKTGDRTPIVAGCCSELLRTTVHLATRFDRSCWRAQFFRQAWKWFTFPLVLPYLAICGARFRKQLKNRLPS